MMLRERFETRRNRINAELLEIDAKKQFFESFSTKYRYKSIEDILDIDICDLITFMIAADDLSLPVSEIESTIKSNQALVEALFSENYARWHMLAWCCQECGLLDVLKKEQKNPRSHLNCYQLEFYEIICQNAALLNLELDAFVKFMILIGNDINMSSRLSSDYYEKRISQEDYINRQGLFKKAIEYKVALAYLKYVRETNRKRFALEKSHRNETAKQKDRRIAKEDKKADINTKELVAKMKRVCQYYESLGEKRDRLVKEQKACDDILALLNPDSTFKSDAEITIPANIEDISLDGIKRDLLMAIYNHNMIFYHENLPMVPEDGIIDYDKLEDVLQAYNIRFADYNDRNIPLRQVKETEKMLEQLKGLGISDLAILLWGLQMSDLQTITNYDSLVKRGIVSVDFLNENMSLFDTSSPSYDAIMRNLALIKNQGIKARCFKDTPSILITSHETFKSGIDTLAGYGLTQSLKEGINPSFVLESDLAEAIDTMLELGYESNLTESIDLLNHRDKFKRLKLAKALNIPLSSTEELLGFLTTDRYIVPDDKIDEYIDNAAEHNLPKDVVILDSPKQENPDVKMLAEYESTPRTYSFDGVIISKERVARNLSMLEETGELSSRLIYSVLKGATLTDEEVSRVINTLSSEKNVAGGPVKLKS